MFISKLLITLKRNKECVLKSVLTLMFFVGFYGAVFYVGKRQEKEWSKLRTLTYLGRIESFSISTNARNVSNVTINLDSKKQVAEQYWYVPPIETGFLVYRNGGGGLVWDADPTLK